MYTCTSFIISPTRRLANWRTLFSLGRASGQIDGRGSRTTGRTWEGRTRRFVHVSVGEKLQRRHVTLTLTFFHTLLHSLCVCVSYLKSSGATVGQNQRQQQWKGIKRAGWRISDHEIRARTASTENMLGEENEQIVIQEGGVLIEANIERNCASKIDRRETNTYMRGRGYYKVTPTSSLLQLLRSMFSPFLTAATGTIFRLYLLPLKME